MSLFSLAVTTPIKIMKTLAFIFAATTLTSSLCLAQPMPALPQQTAQPSHITNYVSPTRQPPGTFPKQPGTFPQHPGIPLPLPGTPPQLPVAPPQLPGTTPQLPGAPPQLPGTVGSTP